MREAQKQSSVSTYETCNGIELKECKIVIYSANHKLLSPISHSHILYSHPVQKNSVVNSLSCVPVLTPTVPTL